LKNQENYLQQKSPQATPDAYQVEVLTTNLMSERFAANAKYAAKNREFEAGISLYE